MRILLILLLELLFLGGKAQRRVQGDIKESKISQISSGYDEREERIYRRPPTYLILASKIVRPSSMYQVIVSLLEESQPSRVRAALSRDGVEVYGDHVNMHPMETRAILLQVPPGNNVESEYRLRVEGAGINGGAIIFENETMLEFSRQFLSISISTNKAVYDGGQDIRVRAVMLDTALQPYTDIADLYIIDPDGFVIRKWNSVQLNVGVLKEVFVLPEFPKVGFWKIRVQTQGQMEEKLVKVEKYYRPKFEVFVRMPTFIFDTESVIKAEVSAAYLMEKTAKGSILLRWYAKKVDGTTPLYNDTVLYRKEYSYYHNISNTYRSQLYDNKDGIPTRNQSQITHPDRYGYLDPYVNTTSQPVRPLFQNWTYLTSERRLFYPGFSNTGPFYLQMNQVETWMGTVQGIQIRAEAYVEEYFYNNTQKGWCETRIINQTLSLRFVGNAPLVFKPGMPFEGAVTVRYHDQVALQEEILKDSELEILIQATMKGGGKVDLPSIRVPRVLSDQFNMFQDIDRLEHYGQLTGYDAQSDVNYNPNDPAFSINPASFFSDDAEKNTEFLFHGLYAKEKSYEEYRKTGVHRFTFDVPEKTEELRMTAYYSDTKTTTKTEAKTTAYASYGPQDRHIFVRSSSKAINVGEYAVFHVKSNFPLKHFDWIIMSKNIILNSGREYGSEIHPIVNTFSIVVSSEMAPGFHIIVYAITRPDDYLLSDSAYFPVKAINRHKIEFKLTQIKDHTMDTVEATCRGDPGAVFLSSTVRSAVFATQGKNTITKASILESLHTFENENRHIHRVFFTDREGAKPDQVTYYPSMDYGVDTNRTFEMKEMIVFTDFVTIPQTPLTRQCNITAGLFPCLKKGCYEEHQICDGQMDCEDGYDESDCGDPFTAAQEATLRFRLSRFNRYSDFYDISDGEWGWFDANIDEDREQFIVREIPLTTDRWFFNVFSISKIHGIGIIAQPIPFDSIRPVHFFCEGPESVHRGESVGIRCMIMNRSPYDLETVIILNGSDDYEFIHVEGYGYVRSYNPRTSSGDHHHLVFVRGEDEMEVHLPIKPTPKAEQGVITVSITLSTQIMSKNQELDIKILPEGSLVHRHTSVMLDLKSRAHVYEYMNNIVDETPIIPYEIYRRYIFGSPYGRVSISGDVIGPTFMNEQPVRLESMFPDGNGRHGKGTEYHIFNLAANTFQLHYYRLTNQFHDMGPLKKQVFEQMNIEYAAVMRRFSSLGWVSIWDKSQPSVWLTAYCIRIFEKVSFQDWEDFIYIDPMVFGSSVMWLLNYQSEEGSFSETEHFPHPLHRAMDSTVDNRNISLTAHVLIALTETADKLQGDVKRYSSTGRQRAIKYLERYLPKISDPYDLAITAYALALSKSSEADAAYGKLLNKKWDKGGRVYWSRKEIITNRVRYEFNRPFLEAKDKQVDDALAVEATSYALLTLFLVEGGGVTVLQDQIVDWLNTMRLGDGGFISTVDTIVATEALVRYSYNNRINDITELNVKVDIPDSNITRNVAVEGKSSRISKLRQIQIPNVWGHVNFHATGAGQAVAQLDVNYGVDYEPFKDHPPEECFNLTINEYFRGRNKSEIDVRSCFSWKCTNESDVSGMAMLVVDIPSGYIMLQPDANRIIRSGVVPQMKDADVNKDGKTIWYFEHITSRKQCFTHTVRRYFPVANLTRTRQAVIIEPLRPEKFYVKTFNATSLYILSICEVCGSYQCPYCPFYSGAPSVHPSSIFILILVILTLTWDRTFVRMSFTHKSTKIPL